VITESHRASSAIVVTFVPNQLREMSLRKFMRYDPPKFNGSGALDKAKA